MATVFLEIVFNAADLKASRIEGRDEIEDPLDEALSDTGLGEVTGGGGGSGVAIVEVEIEDELKLDEALTVMRRVLQTLNVPASTIIKRSDPAAVTYGVYE